MADQATWNITEAKNETGIAYDFTGTLSDSTITGLAVQGQRGLAIRSLHIDSSDPAGVSTLLLRRLQLGEVLALARQALNERIDHDAPEPAPPPAACSCGCHPRPRQFPKDSRYTTIDEAFLRRIALAYIEETAAGRGALVRLATRFDRPEMTVRTWIKRAREAGWLAPGASGRLGAEPGPKLLKTN